MTINNGREDAVARVMELTGGLGADVAIEAVGVPETFELCTDLIRPGRPRRQRRRPRPLRDAPPREAVDPDVTITTGLVDTVTTPTLLQLIEQGKLDPTPFATHRFALADTMAAYDTFAAAAESNALKVVLEAERLAIEPPHREELVGAGV